MKQAHIPKIATALFSLWLLIGLTPRNKSEFNLKGFGELPVLNGGRTKPLDSIARNSLLVLSGKQSILTPDGKVPHLPWLLDVLFNQEKAQAYNIFTIDNPNVLGAIGIMQTDKRRFSYRDLEPHFSEIGEQAAQAEAVKSELRTPYQTAALNLHHQLTLYQKLQNTLRPSGAENSVHAIKAFEARLGPALKAHLEMRSGAKALVAPLVRDLERFRFMDQAAEFFALPPAGWWKEESWTTFGHGVLERIRQDRFHPAVTAYAHMGDAWRAEKPAAFNAALGEYQSWLKKMAQKDYTHAKREFLFNHFQPFYKSMILYVMVLLLAFFSWITLPKVLSQTAFSLLGLAFVVHTAGLVARIILQGRPPVTNLYSSAIFVGWVAVLLGLVLERLYRNGIGSAVGSAIGFLTLIVAHHLASSGDTLEMMRAVLDSNFWLATHVVTITIGYGSTFLSGFLAIVYVFRERFDRHWNDHAAELLENMVFGVVCFSLFFSFIGTILGGIWADQSWGRFWGWDPKENGALMIVLWNALILHARAGKFCERSAMMAMAIFGNVVTAFSWFGVNMLGIGLHSYGFMDKAFFWLLAFAASQLLLISLCLIKKEN